MKRELFYILSLQIQASIWTCERIGGLFLGPLRLPLSDLPWKISFISPLLTVTVISTGSLASLCLFLCWRLNPGVRHQCYCRSYCTPRPCRFHIRKLFFNLLIFTISYSPECFLFHKLLLLCLLFVLPGLGFSLPSRLTCPPTILSGPFIVHSSYEMMPSTSTPLP